MEIIKIPWNQRKVSTPKMLRIIGKSMPGLAASIKSVEEGETSILLGVYVSRLLPGLIPLSCYIFLVFFHFSCLFSSRGFSKKGRM